MLRVGLTGGIACGKSTVGEMLARRGAHLLQADVLAHQLYAPGAAVYGEVVHHFGREILNEDGTINRATLARVAFPNRIGELNAIVHPAVIKAQNEWMAEVARENPHGIAVVEAALIIEAGVARDFDKIIVVTCDFERRVERYAERASISLAAALSEVDRRGAAQLPDEEKVRHADYVIENSGAVEDTERQVEQIWNKLQTLASGCS
ncbi:MAG: dephospho-CoA kinase [Candidatus Korobacteraceae bacterium]